jgi:hypothetical protein
MFAPWLSKKKAAEDFSSAAGVASSAAAPVKALKRHHGV